MLFFFFFLSIVLPETITSGPHNQTKENGTKTMLILGSAREKWNLNNLAQEIFLEQISPQSLCFTHDRKDFLVFTLDKKRYRGQNSAFKKRHFKRDVMHFLPKKPFDCVFDERLFSSWSGDNPMPLDEKGRVYETGSHCYFKTLHRLLKNEGSLVVEWPLRTAGWTLESSEEFTEIMRLRQCDPLIQIIANHNIENENQNMYWGHVSEFLSEHMTDDLGQEKYLHCFINKIIQQESVRNSIGMTPLLQVSHLYIEQLKTQGLPEFHESDGCSKNTFILTDFFYHLFQKTFDNWSSDVVLTSCTKDVSTLGFQSLKNIILLMMTELNESPTNQPLQRRTASFLTFFMNIYRETVQFYWNEILYYQKLCQIALPSLSKILRTSKEDLIQKLRIDAIGLKSGFGHSLEKCFLYALLQQGHFLFFQEKIQDFIQNQGFSDVSLTQNPEPNPWNGRTHDWILTAVKSPFMSDSEKQKSSLEEKKPHADDQKDTASNDKKVLQTLSALDTLWDLSESLP